MKATLWKPAMSALLLGSLMVGCGHSDRDKTAPVTGTVTFNGEPVADGAIVFELPGSRPANGEIVDGEIVNVTTYEPGDGAPVGHNKVALFAYDPAKANQRLRPRPGVIPIADYLPQRYGDPERSGLTAIIEAGEENVLTYDLTSK